MRGFQHFTGRKGNAMLRDKKLFLFDIDGTLAVGDTLLDGTRELLEYIERIGGRALYITNNSTKGRKDYVEKFRRWNLRTTESDFVTASYAACLDMKKRYDGQKIFVVGTRSFVRELQDFGLRITEKVEPDICCVLVGYDSELTYQKTVDACELLSREKIDFAATNPDLCCPAPFGFVPDCGAICKMIFCAAGREPRFIGKPEKGIVDLCLAQTGFSPEETVVVGDRLYTDIACGINGKVDTALVFTGEAQPQDLQDTHYKPTWCYADVQAMVREVEEF